MPNSLDMIFSINCFNFVLYFDVLPKWKGLIGFYSAAYFYVILLGCVKLLFLCFIIFCNKFLSKSFYID